MSNFYVCKLLKTPGLVMAETVVYGNVEIRPGRQQDFQEMTILKESVMATKHESEIDLPFACRVGVIVQAESSDEADAFADEHFVEVLDLLSVEYPISQLALAQCGYVKNLETGEYKTITKLPFNMGNIYVRQMHMMPSISTTQAIMHRTGDLIDRYKRSIHWSRNASKEKSIHLGILYRWFALEALFKENEHDDVTSPLLLFLGFPGNTFSKNISRDLLHRLSLDASYSKWKRQIKGHADKIRKFRNDSVHSGFRSIDCLPENLRLYDRIMTVGLPRCQNAVQTGIILNDLKSVPEFKEYAGQIFEHRANVENDIIGTVVHILEHDSMKQVHSTHD